MSSLFPPKSPHVPVSPKSSALITCAPQGADSVDERASHALFRALPLCRERGATRLIANRTKTLLNESLAEATLTSPPQRFQPRVTRDS